jgi:DNA-binding protein Fis
MNVGDTPEPVDGFDMQGYLSDIRKRLIDRALEMTEGRQNRAAKLLGVTPQALSKFLQTKGENGH